MGNVTLNIVAFLYLKFLPQVMQIIGLYAALYTFAAFCILGGIFLLIFLPETKGKSLAEISALLDK